MDGVVRILVFVLFCWVQCFGTDTARCGNFSVERNQAKNGFHRNIITELEWDVGELNVSLTSCQFLLIESIPKGLYVDLDEIQGEASLGGPKVFCEDKINTELLAHKENSHQIFVYPHTQLMANGHHSAHSQCVLPVHLRYHQPQLSDGFAEVILQPPKILVKYNGHFEGVGCDLPTAQAYCDAEGKSVCNWLVLYSPTELDKQSAECLSFRVPVGLEEHGLVVAVVTLFLTAGGCLLIILGMWTHQ